MSANANKTVIAQADGPTPSSYLSNMIVSGDKVYLAGVIGMDASHKLVEGGVGPETTLALKTASDRLALVGLDLSDVISVTIFVNNYSENFAGLNQAYIEAFPKTTPLPVRCAVGVAALPLNAAVEFSIVAAARA